MKKMLIAIAFLIALRSVAQNSEILTLSLSKAMEIGIQNRYDAKANKLTVAIADNFTQKNKKEWSPEIIASSTIKYNTQLQKTVFPSGFDGSGQSQTITLGAKNQSVFSLDLTQNLYKPGVNTDVRIAKNESLLEQEKNNEKDINIKQSIAEAYLNSILKELQLKLSNASAERYAHYYKLAEEKYKLGTIISNDLLKTKLDYENTKIAAEEAQQNYDLALMQLKYQLNINTSQPIVLLDSVESLEQNYSISLENTNATKRTELKQLKLQTESNRLRLLRSKQYFLPTVSVIANYSTQFQGDNFDYSQKIWSPYNYVGLKLSLPITGNLKNHNTIKEYHLKIEQNKLQLMQKESDIQYEIEKARTELLNAQKAMASTKNNLDLSGKVYENQLTMYRLGSLTYSNVLDTESSLNTAEQNYVKAVYNYLLARINYQKNTK